MESCRIGNIPDSKFWLWKVAEIIMWLECDLLKVAESFLQSESYLLKAAELFIGLESYRRSGDGSVYHPFMQLEVVCLQLFTNLKILEKYKASGLVLGPY